MELWVRSQDREKLIKIEKIFIDNTCPEMESTGKYCIGTEDWYGNNKYYKLGMYKTRERALEVFDEIHQRLIDLQTLTIEPSCYRMIKRNINCVYEIPKE